MRYLSIDIEATGLTLDDYIIEFGAIPFDTGNRTLEENLVLHSFIECPSFESLKPKLNPWVIEHNQDLITKASKEGITLDSFKKKFEAYLSSPEIQAFFKNEKKENIILFGKSLNAIDLPFLTRDLGYDFMQKYFHHRVCDLSSTAYTLVDMNLIPAKAQSGSGLMEYLGMGEICHTALEDAKNTAIMYFKLLERFSK